MSNESISDHPLSPEHTSNFEGLSSFSLAKTENSSKMDVEKMNQSELLALHAKIEGKLTGIRLSEVNLEKETLIQFQRAKKLQEDASDSKDIPMNQRAQVQNSLGNLLTALARMQMELFNSEQTKRLRAAVIKVVKQQPKEFQDAFFDILEHEFEAVEKELAE